MYYDLIYILPALLFSLWASARVKITYRKYGAVRASSGMSAAEAARRILDANGLTDVPVERVAGELTDHFDPTANVIRLSESVYGSSSIAAIGVAAHECGHAVQYARGYLPIRIRAAIIPATNIGSRLSVPLLLLGLLLSAVSEQLIAVAYAGVLLFGFCVLFQLVTLPVEFNASRRALTILRDGAMLQGDELRGARSVLSAAAMTYVAALASALLQFLRLLSIASSGRRRR
ncbi:MAG: zinc metallopeptidase [Eubacteriales bacterium]